MDKILIVDDDVFFRDILVRLLSEKFDVCSAGGVKEALEILNCHNVNLICSDYNMQDGTGLDLFHQLNEKDINTKFIIMSAVDNSKVLEHLAANDLIFLEKTDTDFLKKIISIAEHIE